MRHRFESKEFVREPSATPASIAIADKITITPRPRATTSFHSIHKVNRDHMPAALPICCESAWNKKEFRDNHGYSQRISRERWGLLTATHGSVHPMDNHSRRTGVATKKTLAAGFVILAAGAGICMNTAGLIGGSPSANATFNQGTATASTTPPGMNLSASSDQKIDTDGTQGSYKPAMDGTTGIGDQCTSLSSAVACQTQSPEAAPQYKAK